MVIRAKSGEYLIDPDTVFLEPSKGQPNFRVMSTQRLKMNGFKKLEKESAVYRRTALFLRNLDGRQDTQTTQDRKKGNQIHQPLD